ncbi:hypothetical protein EOL96_00715 [Candidatus Saccharibacteria bacterium]|nr:hypothetical protein [Candidatus Saccharibacteria bacterium]
MKLFRRFATNKPLRVVGLALCAALAWQAIAPIGNAQAVDDARPVNIYMFWGEGCPHCASAKQVLDPYADSRSYVTFLKYEVYYNIDSQKKMRAVGEALNVDASGVPFIIVGDTPYIGFSNTIGSEIKERVEYCAINGCPDRVAGIVGANIPTPGTESAPPSQEQQPAAPIEDSEKGLADKTIELPIFGEINVAQFSLPLLTIIIALLDGFNPCAMWALLFIITLLIGMNDRRKMWLYGTTFIAVSAAVYFVFMVAWLNLFMFIGQVVWVRTFIGLLAVGIGVYYLYDWYQNRTGCKITGGGRRKEVFAKLRDVVREKNVWLALGGIILLAAAVNIVELACSAGLPVLYTGILSSAGLETWQHYGYMLLYILFFMLDDLVVFFIAMTTLKVTGIESKYTRTIRLVGGVVMCILGILLIFAPQLLMFG